MTEKGGLFMRRILGLVVSLLSAVLVLCPTEAQERVEPLITQGAWARATVLALEAPAMNSTPEAEMPMSAVSAAYMTLENHGENPLRLITAATPAAGIVEIHETTIQNDVMQMRPVEGGIIIAAGDSVVLEPGGLHVMLLDLQHELVQGEALALTLTFELLNDDGTFSGELLERIIGVPIVGEPVSPSSFTVITPWARPTVKAEAGTTAMQGDVSAVFLSLRNDGGSTERLIRASTTAAEVVEIHETTMQGDVMKMRPIAGLDLPAGEVVALEPGGMHIMLLGLTQPLVAGEAITLTLVFESGTELTIAVPVYDGLLMDL